MDRPDRPTPYQRATLLAGTLSPWLDVSSLLGYIIQHRLSGRLTLASEDAHIAVDWSDGQLVRADGNTQVDALIASVYADGRISAAQQTQARQHHHATAQACVDAWTEAKVLRPETAWDILHAHHLAVFEMSLTWQKGTYAFDCHEADELIEPAHIASATLLDRAVCRHLTIEALDAMLGSTSLAPCGGHHVILPLDLTEVEQRFVAELNGVHTLATAAERAQLNVLRARQLTLVLIRLGCISFQEDLRQIFIQPNASMHTETWPQDGEALLNLHYERSAKEDYFDILGTLPNATPKQMAAAADFFSALCQRYVRKVGSGQTCLTTATLLLEIVDDARDVLLDGRRFVPYLAHINQALRSSQCEAPHN